MEHLVSEGLKEGHKVIEGAEKAQRRTHGSLENPHQRTSASSVRLPFFSHVCLPGNQVSMADTSLLYNMYCGSCLHAVYLPVFCIL